MAKAISRLARLRLRGAGIGTILADLERHYRATAREDAAQELYSAAASNTIRAETVKTVRIALVTARVMRSPRKSKR